MLRRRYAVTGALDGEFFFQLGLALVPPLALIFLVLGFNHHRCRHGESGRLQSERRGALLMAGYRLTQGEKRSFTPALMALGSLVVIALLVSNFNLNIKLIASSTEAIAITAAAAATVVLLFSLGWSLLARL